MSTEYKNDLSMAIKMDENKMKVYYPKMNNNEDASNRTT